MNRTRIKICGLTREEDVDDAVAAGADAIGFVIYAASPRYVSPARAAELAARLPPYVTPVLLFVNESLAKVASACALLPHALLQFHGPATMRSTTAQRRALQPLRRRQVAATCRASPTLAAH